MASLQERVILAVDAAPACTGLSWWVVNPDIPIRRSLVRWAVLTPDKRVMVTPAQRIAWTEAAAEQWIAQFAMQPTDVVCERLFGFGVHPAQGMDTSVAGFKSLAVRWKAYWKTYQPREWRSHVGGHNKLETAELLTRFLDWSIVTPPPMTEAGLNGWDAIGIGLYFANQLRVGLEPQQPRKKSRLPAGARPANVRRTDYRTREAG